jgi:hypothetical protein
MYYQDVSVKLAMNERPVIRVIYAVLANELRMQIARSLVLFEEELAVPFTGMFSGCTRDAISWVADSQDMGAYPLAIPPLATVLQTTGSMCMFPNLAKLVDHDWRRMVDKKKELLSRPNRDGLCLKEELMRTVWDPRRLSSIVRLDSM